MKHNLHKMVAMLVASIFAVSAFAQDVKTDYTDAIKNASVASLENWDAAGEGISYGDGLVKLKKNFDFSQTITLPAGKYKMTVKAAYRYAGGEVNVAEKAEYDAIMAGINTHLAKVYAQTATYKYEGDVQNRWEGRSETDLYGNLANVSVIEHEGVTYYVPNSSAAVMAWFNADKYVNELVFNVQEEGEVKIGVNKTETAPNGEYTNISSWTLTRLGDAEADPEVEETGDVVLVDCTDKVGTSKEAWNSTQGPVKIDGISMPEKYETTTETLGDVMWQTVEGLENGKYTVELWANARYTSGRGFDSQAADGAENFTYLYANNVEISIAVYHNGDLNNNKSYKLEGVEVTDGTLKMGMTKKAAGSNWHTIQIKSLVLHVSNNEAFNIAKADLKAALDEANAVSPATETLTAAIAAAQNVYDNSESVDDLNAAIAALKNATVLANNTNAVAGATPAAPVVTGFVVNGTFDASTDPWKTTTGAQNQALASNQSGAFTGNFFENWNPNPVIGKIYQVIENVPNGLYELSICAFVNNFDASVQYVYANADQVALTAGEPTAYTVRTKVENNTIEVGLEQTAAKANWLGIDNVSLKYLGSASEEEIARADFLTLKNEFDYFSTGIYEVMYVGRVGDAYYALSETVWTLADKADATVEEYEACMAEMQKVMDDIKAIDAYYSATFSPLADECFNVQDNSIATSEEAAAAFEEACDKMGWEGTTNVATIADLQAIVAAVEPVLHDYVQNALPINGYAFDYSFFLVNPSFETGDLTGWTIGGDGASQDTGVKANSDGTYHTEGAAGSYIFNTWWRGVYLTQEAEGLPNGNYRLTVSLSSGDGGNAATVYLVANGEQKGFVMDHKGEFEDCSIDFKVTDGKISIASVGGQDDETDETPGTFVENGYWWYKSDNYRIYYLGDGGVTGVSLWTKETYYDEWADEDVQYDLEWEMPRFTEIGQTFKFEVEVEAPEDADKTITWSVSDEKVLSIDETGLLTVIGSGQGTYEVKATAPNGICAICEVYVRAFQKGDITEMEIVYDGWGIEATEAGATYQLAVEYNEDATNVDIVWSSEDESVATVDQNGLVTIVGNGYTNIVATASSGVEASISVWVEGIVNGIKSVESATESVIYDLQGRRVQKMEKGLYIVNGKKVVVK